MLAHPPPILNHPSDRTPMSTTRIGSSPWMEPAFHCSSERADEYCRGAVFDRLGVLPLPQYCRQVLQLTPGRPFDRGEPCDTQCHDQPTVNRALSARGVTRGPRATWSVSTYELSVLGVGTVLSKSNRRGGLERRKMVEFFWSLFAFSIVGGSLVIIFSFF